jgi:hypothetical protein
MTVYLSVDLKSIGIFHKIDIAIRCSEGEQYPLSGTQGCARDLNLVGNDSGHGYGRVEAQKFLDSRVKASAIASKASTIFWVLS